MKRYLSLCLAALLVLALLPTMALAAEYQVSKEELVTAIQAIQDAQSGAIATIKLIASFNVNVDEVAENGGKFTIPDGVTIDGDNNTITVTGSAAASLFLVSGKGSSAKIQDLKINGAENIKHGMQAYGGAKLAVENVEVRDCTGYALVVNGSTVTVNGLTTSGNDWGGINVDLGSGVTTSADLTIKNATIAEGNSVYVEHRHGKGKQVTATIKGGSFQSVVIAEGQTEKTTLKVSGGTFKIPPTEYVSSNKTVCTVNDTTYVNTEEGITQDIGTLGEGCIITVWKGDLVLPKLPADAKVTNKGTGQVTVGSNLVGPGESYPPQPTEPTKPIAGVVIGGGNQQEDEDEPEQSPSNTLRYAVICRTLNVRSGPGTEYSKLGTLSRGTLLDGELLSNGWVKFSYNGQTAYVSGMYVQSVDNGQLSVQCGTLNVRSGAGTSYSKIGALYRGTYVKPLETQGNWYKIGYDGGYGWICADYVG